VVAIVVVIGLQLLPTRSIEGVQFRIERIRPIALSVGLAVLIAMVGATVSSQGVAPFIYFRF
jgi:alginate O-acetyltransferase complex protein AlgI